MNDLQVIQLEIALALAQSNSKEAHEVLKRMCKSQPWLIKILRLYEVEVGEST